MAAVSPHFWPESSWTVQLEDRRHRSLRRAVESLPRRTRERRILAGPLDRGEIGAWRELYGLASADARLRRRFHRIVLAVSLPFPRFRLAALANLGEDVDLHAPAPAYDQGV